MLHVQEKSGIYLFTTQSLEGYVIDEYYGLVIGKAIYGANFVKDFFARITDTVGGRAGGYERTIDGAISSALAEMAEKARRCGANAVIGIDIDTSAVNHRMLMASCYGTAVRILPKR